MRRLITGILVCFLSAASLSYAAQLNPVRGSLKEEVAYRIAQPGEFTKLKSQLILMESGKLTEDLKFKVSGRAYYDAVYSLTDHYPGNVGSDQKMEAELRDTYLDYSRGPFDLRLGKQQVVWGEAVGLFFADVVNAKDLREFILPDFDMIRIPQWGVDAEYVSDKFHAELVWLPIHEFNRFGVTDSEFVFPYPVPEGVNYTARDPAKPKNSFENSEVGLRLSYLLNGWDMSLFNFYTWDKNPVMHRQIVTPTLYSFTPDYRRVTLTGATFAKEIKDAVLKGEFVFNHQAHFSTFDPTNSDGVVQKDFLDYLLGVDYTFGKVNTNLQFMQKVIFDYDHLLVNERKVLNSLSFWASRAFLNEALSAEFLVIANLNENDLIFRPKLTYNLRSNWKLRLGLDIFDGVSDGIFGKFDKKDRVYSELTFSF